MTTREHLFKNVLPWFNIQEYWDKGFKGQGVTIASVEETKSGHGQMVADTVRTYAPNCKLISWTDINGVSAVGDVNEKQRFPEFVDWCIKNNVDIITSSLDWSCNRDNEKEAIKKLYEHGIIFCNCAGNDGDNIHINNKNKTWGFGDEIITVSGIGLDTSRKVRWSGFNYGEAVDICGLGSYCPVINESDASYSWSGTSAATPFVASMLAVYKSFDKTLNSKNVFEKLINKMDKTIEHEGFTHKILVLPKIEHVEVKMPTEEKPNWKKEFEEIWKKATEKGIVDGTRPDDAISRNELVVILNRLGLIK